jgi:ketosteroid isomerase-like protein
VTIDLPPAGAATGADGHTIAVWDATIWQRDAAGRWRIAVDISTPLPAGRR